MQIFPILIGFILVLVAVLNLGRLIYRSNWHEAQAEILVSRITPLEPDEFYITQPNPRTGMPVGFGLNKKLRLKSGYHPKLLYKYSVRGKEYLGTNYHSAPLWMLNPSKLRFLTEGATERIFYSPQDPSKSFVKKSSVLPTTALFLLGLGCVQYKTLLDFLGGAGAL